jgi:EEF1A N-terminal glycine/lysine methyltransferase
MCDRRIPYAWECCADSCIQVVISDYPAKVVIENIRRNAAKNIPFERSENCRVEGHAWGVLDTPLALENKHHFTRILAADCYWLSGQHENLVRSMLHFLSLEPTARIFVIAGFHTGRARLANFFEVADEHGLEPDEIYEEDDQGKRREWLPERDNGREDHTERKKWLVICRLKRKAV